MSKPVTLTCVLADGFVLLALLAGCAAPASVAAPTPSPASEDLQGLSADQVASLRSLEKVDDFPLYTMRYAGAYDEQAITFPPQISDERERAAARLREPLGQAGSASPSWGCALFAALGDAHNRLYGRNFDWEYSPALLLFTDPPDGYASVTMVDMAYLDINHERLQNLEELPLAERKGLLEAPRLPFDGMNEHGLAVGMAAVPAGEMRPDPAKPTVGSLQVIRMLLDTTRTVGEALTLFESVNIDFQGGPPLHYLVADASGAAALVEFSNGERVITTNEPGWQAATNFLLAQAGEDASGECWRYDRLSRELGEAGGRMSSRQGMEALAGVAQDITQWSILYHLSTGEVMVALGGDYADAHRFVLEMDWR